MFLVNITVQAWVQVFKIPMCILCMYFMLKSSTLIYRVYIVQVGVKNSNHVLNEKWLYIVSFVHRYMVCMSSLLTVQCSYTLDIVPSFWIAFKTNFETLCFLQFSHSETTNSSNLTKFSNLIIWKGCCTSHSVWKIEMFAWNLLSFDIGLHLWAFFITCHMKLSSVVI